MGSVVSARLAYGYDLGTPDDFKAAQRGEYGGPDLPWYGEDSDDFPDAAMHVLLASVGFTEKWSKANDGYYQRKSDAEERVGVEVDICGSWDYSGWLLIAKGSRMSAEWAEAMALDLDGLAATVAGKDWDTRLPFALAALGITPTQDRPKWLVYPFYG